MPCLFLSFREALRFHKFFSQANIEAMDISNELLTEILKNAHCFRALKQDLWGGACFTIILETQKRTAWLCFQHVGTQFTQNPTPRHTNPGWTRRLYVVLGFGPQEHVKVCRYGLRRVQTAQILEGRPQSTLRQSRGWKRNEKTLAGTHLCRQPLTRPPSAGAYSTIFPSNKNGKGNESGLLELYRHGSNICGIGTDAAYSEMGERVACSNCQRRFSSDRVDVHQEICMRVNTGEIKGRKTLKRRASAICYTRRFFKRELAKVHRARRPWPNQGRDWTRRASDAADAVCIVVVCFFSNGGAAKTSYRWSTRVALCCIRFMGVSDICTTLYQSMATKLQVNWTGSISFKSTNWACNIQQLLR